MHVKRNVIGIMECGGQIMPRNQYIETYVAECKKNFNGMIDHPYIQKYVDPPTVDEDKIRFIFLMLSNVLPKEELNDYALAAMLVDASLSTHDKVSLKKINSDYVKKNRQLTVLGGDYYSSLYYRLLSINDYVPMIHIFALSIQTINEHKMILYNNNILPYEQVKESIANIEAALLLNMAEHYGMTAWREIIKEYFFLKRFMSETEQLLLNKKKPIIQAVIHERFGNEYSFGDVIDVQKLQFACELKIENTKDNLLKKLREVTQEVTFIDHFIEDTRNFKEKVAEEG